MLPDNNEESSAAFANAERRRIIQKRTSAFFKGAHSFVREILEYEIGNNALKFEASNVLHLQKKKHFHANPR